MVTVLLVDDAFLFKAVEGTSLRRDRCRLIKSSPRDTVRVAREISPDLVLIHPATAASRDALSTLLVEPDLSSIPVLVLASGKPGAQDSTGPRPDGPSRKAPVETLRVSKAAGFASIDRALDAAVRRHLSWTDRSDDRIPVSVPVQCQGHGIRTTLRTKNISPSGLFLKTDRELAPGKRFRVSFRLPEAGEAPGAPPSVQAECEVVRRVRPSERSERDLIPGLGVRFIGMEGATRSVLERFVHVAGHPDTPPVTTGA